MDEALIRGNCRRYRAAFDARYPRNAVCFAGKSFLTMAMCRIIDEEGLCLDVASQGELYVALRSGFPARRINLHGNNKSREELEMAVARRVGHVVIDNMEYDESRTISLKRFYLRRILRIFPPFYLILMGSALLAASGALPYGIRLVPTLAQACHVSNFCILAHEHCGVC